MRPWRGAARGSRRCSSTAASVAADRPRPRRSPGRHQVAPLGAGRPERGSAEHPPLIHRCGALPRTPSKRASEKASRPMGRRWLQADLRATVAQHGTERQRGFLRILERTRSCVFIPTSRGSQSRDTDRHSGARGPERNRKRPPRLATKRPTRSGASACGTAEAFRAPTRTDYGPWRSTSAFLLVRGRMRSFTMSVKSSASGATSKTMAPSLLVPGFMSMASSSRFSVEA
jgi:hypothetical protein